MPHQCPGNRRWIQLLCDAWLLLPSQASRVDARDAMLAADQLRTRRPTGRRSGSRSPAGR
jgi:Fungalysin metallopeptidase (M36)